MEFTTRVTSSSERGGNIRLEYTKLSGQLEGRELFEEGPEIPRYLREALARTIEVDQLGKVNAIGKSGADSLGGSTGISTYDTFVLFPVLPREPVAPGDTWTARQENRKGSTASIGTSRNIFEGWTRRNGRRLARIRSVLTVAADRVRDAENARTEVTQTYLFDPSEGRLVRSEGVMTVQGEEEPYGKTKSEYEFEVDVRGS